MDGSIIVMMIYEKYPSAYMDLSKVLEIPRMGGNIDVVMDVGVNEKKGR